MAPGPNPSSRLALGYEGRKGVPRNPRKPLGPTTTKKEGVHRAKVARGARCGVSVMRRAMPCSRQKATILLDERVSVEAAPVDIGQLVGSGIIPSGEEPAAAKGALFSINVAISFEMLAALAKNRMC